MIDLNENHTVTQYGRVLPNGAIDWQTADVWNPAWATKEGRDEARAAHRESLAQLGVEITPEMELKFITRTKTVTYSEITDIDDSSIDDDSDAGETASESS